MSGLPPHYRREIEHRLDQIAELFRPGARVTLLVRHDLGPAKDADVVLTTDTLPQAIEALRRRHAAEGERA